MLLLALVLVGGCGSTAPPSGRPTEQAATTPPYEVRFVNDTTTSVAIVGCQGCGIGHEVNSGQTWLTVVGGGETDVTFTHGGSLTGCVHFVNGALPDGSQTPSAIDISRYSPCADSAAPSATSPGSTPSGRIAPQVGQYSFGDGGFTLSPPSVGTVTPVSVSDAIANATRQAELQADVRTTTPSVSYGVLSDRSGNSRLVIDVRWLDVLGLGGLGGPGPSGSTPVPISTDSPQDINVILDPATGQYLEEMDDGRAAPHS